MSFLGRLRRLEGGGSPACPECGHVPGTPMRFVIHTRDDPPYQGPENCPACRRPLTFTFDVAAASARSLDVAGEEEEGGGGEPCP